MVIIVDIDNTICKTVPSDDGKLEYEKSEPIYENIEKINKKYDEGNTIIYWTARGSLRPKSSGYFHLTLSQLREWGCKFHELRMGKPYYDLIICDKSKRIEEIL